MYGYGSCYYLPRIDLKNEELLWSKNIIIGQATRPPDKGMVWRLAGSYSWSIDLLSSNQLATPSSAFCSKLSASLISMAITSPLAFTQKRGYSASRSFQFSTM